MSQCRFRLFALLPSALAQPFRRKIALSLIALTHSTQAPTTTTNAIASPDSLRVVTTDPKTNVIVLKATAF